MAWCDVDCKWQTWTWSGHQKGQPKKGGCSTVQLPKERMSIYSSLLMYGSVWSGMGAYSGSFWPVSEYMVVKKSQPDRVLFYRTLGDVRQHFSVQRTSTPVCWSSRSHCYMMSSRLWPSVLPYAGQLRFYLCWSGYKCSIQGRHTISGALLLCWKMLDVCLYVWFEYFFVRSPRSDLLLWSHFVYVGSNSGRDRFPVQGTLHGLLPPELGHVEHTGLEGIPGPTTWHILGLKCISHVFSDFSSFWRSCCRVWESSLLVTAKYTAVSSAKRLTCEFMFSGRSFMYRRNKTGPRTEPWGTPKVTGISDDFPPSKATHCERPSKNALIQPRLFWVIPWWWSLTGNLVWLTLSKALLKSRSMRSVWRPEERPLASSSIGWINWVSQDLRSLKPCCWSYSMLCLLRCFVRFGVMMCFINLQQMLVSEIGR